MSAPPPRMRDPTSAGLRLQSYNFILNRQNKTAIIFLNIIVLKFPTKKYQKFSPKPLPISKKLLTFAQPTPYGQ